MTLSYIYRIKNKDDLYSDANVLNIQWSNSGYVFCELTSIMNHLRAVYVSFKEHPEHFNNVWPYADCQVLRIAIEDLKFLHSTVDEDIVNQINLV